MQTEIISIELMVLLFMIPILPEHHFKVSIIQITRNMPAPTMAITSLIYCFCFEIAGRPDWAVWGISFSGCRKVYKWGDQVKGGQHAVYKYPQKP